MTSYDPPEVQIATLKARNAQLLLALADVDHLIRLHALHGLADAREALARLREKVAGKGHDADPAFALIDAQLSDVEHKLEHRQCDCTRTDRVALVIGEEPLPGKVVPIRKVAVVRKPPTVRDLLREAIAALKPAKPCPRTSADEFSAAHGIETDEDGGVYFAEGHGTREQAEADLAHMLAAPALAKALKDLTQATRDLLNFPRSTIAPDMAREALTAADLALLAVGWKP